MQGHLSSELLLPSRPPRKLPDQAHVEEPQLGPTLRLHSLVVKCTVYVTTQCSDSSSQHTAPQWSGCSLPAYLAGGSTYTCRIVAFSVVLTSARETKVLQVGLPVSDSPASAIDTRQLPSKDRLTSEAKRDSLRHQYYARLSLLLENRQRNRWLLLQIDY